MVSVLVSVVDPEPPRSLLQRQLRLEARVGIEPTRTFGAGPVARRIPGSFPEGLQKAILSGVKPSAQRLVSFGRQL
jgi:hypothetical protein